MQRPSHVFQRGDKPEMGLSCSVSGDARLPVPSVCCEMRISDSSILVVPDSWGSRLKSGQKGFSSSLEEFLGLQAWLSAPPDKQVSPL